jgi:hypothetical protein
MPSEQVLHFEAIPTIINVEACNINAIPVYCRLHAIEIRFFHINSELARTEGIKEKVLERGMMELELGIYGVFGIGYPHDGVKSANCLVKCTLVKTEKVRKCLGRVNIKCVAHVTLEIQMS